jgi:hypothetical protein
LARWIGAIVAPTTLAAALAYYFGYRRQEAFGGYFGIDPSLLDFSPTDYALRSVDALFVPFLGALLVVLGVACLAALLAGRRLPFDAAPALAALGAAGLTVGILLAAGHPVTSNWIPVQALALGLGALAVTAALGRRASTVVRIAGFSILLLSLFWAVSEYADDRGDALARRLAANMHAAPEIHIFSKEGLHVTPGEFPGACVTVTRSSSADYRYHYSGLSLLVRSGDKYFVTPTPTKGRWSRGDRVLVIPDSAGIRIEVAPGPARDARPAEATAAGSLAFAC